MNGSIRSTRSGHGKQRRVMFLERVGRVSNYDSSGGESSRLGGSSSSNSDSDSSDSDQEQRGSRGRARGGRWLDVGGRGKEVRAMLPFAWWPHDGALGSERSLGVHDPTRPCEYVMCPLRTAICLEGCGCRGYLWLAPTRLFFFFPIARGGRGGGQHIRLVLLIQLSARSYNKRQKVLEFVDAVYRHEYARRSRVLEFVDAVSP